MVIGNISSLPFDNDKFATGFISKIGQAEGNQDEELSQFLKGLKSEDELDVPSFLLRPLFSHRRQAITPSTNLVKTPSQTPLL